MSQDTIELSNGWNVCAIVDDDGHLNVYIANSEGTSDIIEIETGQGDGENGEQYALRFTTEDIESAAREDWEEKS
jgi:hypothetical protein